MSHWTKFDHTTFLVAFVLAVANIYFQRLEFSITIVIFMLMALVYDVMETKKK